MNTHASHEVDSATRRGRRGIVLAGVLVIAALIAGFGLNWVSQQRSIDRVEAETRRLQAVSREAGVQHTEQLETDLLQELGFSAKRVEADSQLLRQLVDTAFTWDSGQAYDAARRELRDRYELSEQEPFLVTFMPGAAYNEDIEGKRYYALDAAGANSEVLEEPEINLEGAAAGDYRYVVLVTVGVSVDGAESEDSPPQQRPQATVERTVLITAQVDAEGRISKLAGIPASGTTRHAG